MQELIGYFDTPEAAMLFLPDGTTEKDILTKAEQLAEFERNKAQIIESIMTGKYLPQPIRGEIQVSCAKCHVPNLGLEIRHLTPGNRPDVATGNTPDHLPAFRG